MVNIIIITNTIFQMDIIVNGSNDIFLGNMLRNQFMYIFMNCFCKFFRIFSIFFNNLGKYRIVNKLCNSKCLCIALYKVVDVYHHIGKNFDILFFCLDVYIRNRCILNLVCQFCSYFCTSCCQNFSGQSIYNIFCKNMMSDSVTECQFLIKFISTDFC